MTAPAPMRYARHARVWMMTCWRCASCAADARVPGPDVGEGPAMIDHYVWLIWSSAFLIPWLTPCRKMHQNQWTVGPTVVAFPLAAGARCPVLLRPSIATPGMSGSAPLVAINALMLKRTKFTGIRNGSAIHSPSASPTWAQA